MCTVILSISPGTETPLLVGANRDEDLNRPSLHFSMSDDGQVLYPLDVGGGTWIGASRSGVFAALTNRDDVKDVRGRKSRGALVTRALRSGSGDLVAKWADDLVPSEYNGFRLIVADRLSCTVWEGDGVSSGVAIKILNPGLHVVTGFGLDTWDIPRCAFIRDELSGRFDIEDLKRVLSSHRSGTVDSDVCIHDPEESHVTVSSCIVRASTDWTFHVDATPIAPCRTRLRWGRAGGRESAPWDKFQIGPSQLDLKK